MSFQDTRCVNGHTYEFYGPRVPPCPQCGWPNQTTGEAYYQSMGIESKPIKPKEEPTCRTKPAI